MSESAEPAPSEPPPLVLRKDPARRTQQGLGLGGGFAVLGALAALVPMVVVAVALWPVERLTESPSGRPVSFAALRAHVVSLGQQTTAAVTAPEPLALHEARVEKARALHRRISEARDERRASGAKPAELREPLSVDELGGPELIEELGVQAGARLLVTRDARVLAPEGARLPEGTDLSSKERDEDVLEANASLAGAPVRVLRRCVAGEALCLVDIVARPSIGGAPEPVSQAALLALIDAEEQALRLAAPSPPQATDSRLPPWVALLLGFVVAGSLGGLLALRLIRAGSVVTAAAHRLRGAVLGKPSPAPADAVAAELTTLHGAIDDAIVAFGDSEARAAIEEKRRACAAALAAALDDAREQIGGRLVLGDLGDLDDTATAEVVAAANRLVETFEARVVRWRSHIEVVTAPAGHSQVEDRAQALTPLPPLLLNVAQRLLRVARLPGLPPKAAEELNALGDALAARGKTAQTLVDQLLLDAAKDRPGERTAAALEALKRELAALVPAPTAPTTVAALVGLPATEIAARMRREQ